MSNKWNNWWIVYKHNDYVEEIEREVEKARIEGERAGLLSIYEFLDDDRAVNETISSSRLKNMIELFIIRESIRLNKKMAELRKEEDE